MMTDPNDNDEETQEHCSNDEENTTNSRRNIRGLPWLPSRHTHVFTADGDDVDELLESLPDDRLDNIIYVDPSDDPECGAYNALKPIEKRVRNEIEADPLESDNERDGLHTLRSGERISGEKLRGPIPEDTVTAFETLGRIARESRQYRRERIKEEFGSVPEYMQAVIDDLEELARTAPHFPPHTFSPSRAPPAMYPIKYLRGRGSFMERIGALERLFEDEDEDA